jgi:DNA-binding GntR family transcriptional regulator
MCLIEVEGAGMHYGATVSDVEKFEYDPLLPGHLWEQVVQHIEARIKAGDLAPRDRLPAEVKLAAEYGVAVNTVRRAVQELRDRGLVVTRPPAGTFIAAPKE